VPCYRPVTAFKPPDGGALSFVDKKDHREIEIPCGQCIGCRVIRQQSWAFRCLAEASLNLRNWFVTLTYSPERLPPHGSLCHRDWQLFAKRTRKRLGKFRYLMCGEYGEQTLRPHYHALLFGLDIPDIERSGVRRGYPIYRSELLSRLWQAGHVEIGSVTPASARYCAGYVLKQSGLPQPVDPGTGELMPVVKPYGRMSLRPGLGSDWIRRYYPEVFAHGACYSQDQAFRIPGAFSDILSNIDPVAFESLQAAAIEKASASPHNTSARLQVRERVQLAKLAKLKEVRDYAV